MLICPSLKSINMIDWLRIPPDMARMPPPVAASDTLPALLKSPAAQDLIEASAAVSAADEYPMPGLPVVMLVSVKEAN